MSTPTSSSAAAAAAPPDPGNTSPTRRGAFVVIEGLDRAGKSTQHAHLGKHLEAQGRKVKLLRFPDRTTPIGASISAYLHGSADLDDHAVHLLFSANRWEAARGIVAAVEAGTTIVVDRYYYSGIVYSAAKGLRDLDLAWARAPEVGLPRPDLVVFLDVPVEAARARGGYGEEKYETEEMQGRVRELFYEVVRMEGKGEGGTKMVDASKSVEEVSSIVSRLVDDLLRGKKLDGELRRIES